MSSAEQFDLDAAYIAPMHAADVLSDIAPDLAPQFSLNSQHIWGTNLPTSPDSRLRSLIRSLGEVDPSATEHLNPSALFEGRDNFQKFMHNKFDVARQDSSGQRIRLQREEYISVPTLMDVFWQKHQDNLDSVTSLLYQLVDENQNREQHNKVVVGGGAKPVLSKAELDQCRYDLMLVLHGAEAKKLVTKEFVGAFTLMHTIRQYGI